MTTLRPKVVECPLCGQGVKFLETRSFTSSGRFRDFQERPVGADYYGNLVETCPRCHFSGYASDFNQKLEEDVKRKVLEKLKPIPLSSDSQKFEFAAKIYIWQKRKNEQIANIYLVGSYLLRGETGPYRTQRWKFQSLAYDYFIKAIEAGEVEADERGVTYYLIGDLYRRIGEFEKALHWYDLTLKEKDNPEGLNDLVKEQVKLTKNKDADNDI